MSGRRFQPHPGFQPVILKARETCLSLRPEDILIRKSGLEFRSNVPIAAWTEMTLSLQRFPETGVMHFIGVVVGCSGDRHHGFAISLIFTNLTRESEERLKSLAYS